MEEKLTAPVRSEDKIPTKEKFIYGAADIFGGGQSSMLSLLLMFFFTDIIGVKPIFAGVAVLVAKIWDAIIDPSFGVITDNTRTKLGRRRPYIIAGGALIMPAMAMLYAPIGGFSEIGKNIWICFAYLIYCSVSSLSQVPFNSMASDISSDYRERNSANTYKLVFDLFSAGLCFLVPSLLLDSVKDGSIPYLSFYFILVFGFGALFSIPLILGGIFVKERAYYDVNVKEKFSIKEYFSTIGVKSFSWLLVMYVAAFICSDVVSALSIYYVVNILDGVTIFGGKVGTLFLIGPIMVCAALVVPLAYYFMRKKSKQFAYRFGIPLYLAGGIALACFQPSWPGYLVPVFAAFAGLGFGGAQVMPWLIFPDTVDVAEFKLDKRPSGSMGGVMTFCRTITTAFATAMVGFVLGGANYMESTAGVLVKQSAETLLAIRLLLGISVTVLLSVGFFASAKYKVTDKKLSRIRYFIEKRREAGLESFTEEEMAEYNKLQKELC